MGRACKFLKSRRNPDSIQRSKQHVTVCSDKRPSKGVYYKNTKTLNERENIIQKPLKKGKK